MIPLMELKYRLFDDDMCFNRVIPITEMSYSHEDEQWIKTYECPACKDPISKGDVACCTCGSFFDWNKSVHVRLIPAIIRSDHCG